MLTMIKNRLTARPWALAAVTVLLVAGVAAIPQQQGTPVAFVESELILPQMPGYAEAESTFSQDMASYQAEVEALRVSFDSAVAAYTQQEAMLSPTVRQQRTTELQQMQQQAQTREQELTQRAQQRNTELLTPFESRIQAVIDGLRAERNIGMIFNVSTPNNQIISADPSLNLTNVVIQRVTTGGP